MRRRETSILGALGRTIALITVLAIAWGAGLAWFAADIPPGAAPLPDPLPESEHTDAIVVLTGGGGRIQAGFNLLDQGAGKKLFISGVYDGVAVRELLDLAARSQSELECCIVLGYAADNTIGNAAETADWMAEQRFTSIRLVTAAYHMPRSLLEFALAMPDVRIIPHPVASSNVHVTEWWRWKGTAHLIAVEYSKYLVVRLRWWIAELLGDT